MVFNCRPAYAYSSSSFYHIILCVCSFSAPTAVLVLDTAYDCVSVLANWTALSDDPCPITGYSVNISGNAVLVAADKTTYSHPISESDCGTTLDIHVSANTVFGTSSVTSESILILCTRKLGIEHTLSTCADVKLSLFSLFE